MRFPEFTELWSFQKFNQLVTIHARIGWQGLRRAEFLDNGNIYLITGTDFYNGKINFQSCKYITKQRYDQDKNIQVKNDDILVTKDGSIGKIAHVSFLTENATLNAGIYRIRVIGKDIYPRFLFHYLNGGRLLEYASKQMTGGTIKHLNQSSIINMPIGFPSIDEQIKIANLLDLIQEKIETQNKIIEDLKTYKNSLVENYFENCQNFVPLSCVLKERSLYSQKGLSYEHVTLSKDGIIPKSERYDRDFLVKDNSKEYKITKLNDICYNPANLKFGVICLNDYGDSIFSPIYVTFEVIKFDPYYVSLYLTSKNFINYILKYQQGTVYERMAVNPEDFTKGLLPFDNDTKSFSRLAKAIALKIKIESNIAQKYNLQKTYLLQNLFI